MKKNLLFVAMMLCCAMTIFAQNNNQISYQAVVRDAENKLVANKNVTVMVKIFDGDIQDPVYTKTYTDVQTNLNGLISLLIGPAANESSDAWMQIHWNQARIETTVTLDGTQLGTLAMPLTAVPYALYADNAAHAVLADRAADLDPNSPIIRDIYGKMTSDSTAIYQTIKVDSAALAERMRADSAALANRMRADSAALANHLKDTLKEYVKKTELCGLVKECVTPDFNAVYNKIEADSLAMVAYVRDTLQTLTYALEQQRTQLINDMNTMIAVLTARIDSLVRVTDSLLVMAQDSFIVTSGKTTFTLKNVPDDNHILRMYINGVMVGGNHTGVLTFSDNVQSKEVTYHADMNKNHNGDSYNLQAGDKVTIVYWYIKQQQQQQLVGPSNANTPGYY